MKNKSDVRNSLSFLLIWVVLLLGITNTALAAGPYTAPCAEAEEKLKTKRVALEECIGEQYSKETSQEQLQKCKAEFDPYIGQTHQLKKCQDNAKLRKVR